MTWRSLLANIPVLMLVGVLMWSWLTVGCAAYRPQPLTEVTFLEQTQTKGDGQVWVSVTVPNPEQDKAISGVSLVDVGIQPVWLRIDNGDPVPYILLPHNVDPHAFSPLEAAYRNHYRFSPTTNDVMDQRFAELSIDKLVPPGAHISGLVYANLDLGV